MDAPDISRSFDEVDLNEDDSSNTDVKHLRDELHRLQAELDECRSLVTVAECVKENVVIEERKHKEEVASIQHIMEEAVTDAVQEATARYELQIAQLKKSNEKLETEIQELRTSKDKSDISKEGVLAAVTKSLKKNLAGPLQFTTSNSESLENLEESMRRAQEDAEMLRSLVVPLEEEIKALKDKLRSTDEKLQLYETAFANLVKGLGSDSMSEIFKGKGPAEVVEHLDEKLTALNQGLQAEKASRSDLEMYVAVLNTQKSVMQEEVDKIKIELQEVCDLLEKEKKEHSQLKITWQKANDQFLEASRLQMSDLRRIQTVLSQEQQRQVREAKEKEEQRMDMLEIKISSEKKGSSSDIDQTDHCKKDSSKTPPSNSLSARNKLLSNADKVCQDLKLPLSNSTRAQSIPDNLNQAESVLSEKRSLSSSALNGLDKDSPSSLLPLESPPVKEANSTPKRVASLTRDQLKALSDLTPELEVRKSLLDNARAEKESFSLVGKRLVSEKEWQLLVEEIKVARDKLGQSCEMCNDYELRLQQSQRLEREQRMKATTTVQTLADYKKDLSREKEYRQEMKVKFDDISKECETKVSQLFKMKDEFDKKFLRMKSNYDACRKELNEYQTTVSNDKEKLRFELEKLKKENDVLLGKHIAKAQQMRNEDINLPDSIEDLHFYCLQKQEELITVKAAKENMEEHLNSMNHMLKNQLVVEQNEREQLLETYTQEIDNLKEQTRMLDTLKHELSLEQSRNAEYDVRMSTLLNDLKEKEDRIAYLESEIADLISSKSKLAEEVYELKSKVQGLQSDLDTSEGVQRDFVKLSQTLQMELEKIRQSGSEVRWQHDEDVIECNSCKKTFQSKKEKLHCNHCGKIFCLDCTSKTVYSGPKKRQFKVCNVCHTLLDHQTAPYFSSEPPLTPS